MWAGRRCRTHASIRHRRPSLTVLEVNDALARGWPRSSARARYGSVTISCRSVFARSTEREQRFLCRRARGRAAPGRARRCDDVDAIAERRRRAGRVGAARVDDGGRPARRRRPSRSPAGREALDAVGVGAEPAGAADAGQPGGRRRRGAGGYGHGVGGVEARRRPHAGPSRRRPGAPLHPQPQRGHRSAAGHRRHRSPRCPAATSCSTVKHSGCSTTARRDGSRTRWATSAPTRRSAGGAVSGRSSST